MSVTHYVILIEDRFICYLDEELDGGNVGILEDIGDDGDERLALHHSTYHVTDTHLDKRERQAETPPV